MYLDIIYNIMLHIDLKTMHHYKQICRYTYQLYQQDYFWKEKINCQIPYFQLSQSNQMNELLNIKKFYSDILNISNDIKYLLNYHDFIINLIDVRYNTISIIKDLMSLLNLNYKFKNHYVIMINKLNSQYKLIVYHIHMNNVLNLANNTPMTLISNQIINKELMHKLLFLTFQYDYNYLLNNNCLPYKPKPLDFRLNIKIRNYLNNLLQKTYHQYFI
jgi:hypothetical protein